MKVLDHKESQKYVLLDAEKDSLRKDIEQIRQVKKDVDISVERRRLMHSQGFTVSPSTDNERDEAEIRTKNRQSANELLFPSHGSASLVRKSKSLINLFPEARAQQTGENLEESSERKSSGTRARHQFRVIEPPSRPGSRRNFIQLSAEALKKECEIHSRNNEAELFAQKSIKVDRWGKVIQRKSLERQSLNTKLNDFRTARLRSQSDTSGLKSEIEGCKGLSPTAFDSEKTCLDSNESEERKRKDEGKEKLTKFFESLDGSITKDNAKDKADDSCHVTSGLHGKAHKPGKRSLTKNDSYKEMVSIDLKILQVVSRPLFQTPQTGSLEKSHDEVNQCNPSCKHSEPLAYKNETKLAAPEIQLNSNEPIATDACVHRPAGDARTRKTHPRDPNSNNNGCHQVSFAKPKEQIGISSTKPNGPSSKSKETLGKTNHRKLSPKSRRRSRSETELERSHFPINSRATSPQPPYLVSSVAERRRRGTRHAWTQGKRVSTGGTPVEEAIYAYDARPNKSLSKGYMEMQMTVAGKHVNMYMPRFSNDSDEPVLARIRNKAINDRFQPRLLAKAEKPKRRARQASPEKDDD